MIRTIAVLAAAGALAGAAGCTSSSSSTTKGQVTSHPASTRPATLSGTERFYGSVKGAAVVANQNPTYPLTFTGPVTTTGTFTPPNSQATHQTGVFKTAAGDMVVSAVVSGQNTPPKPAGLQGGHQVCRIAIRATYVVDGAKSTGRFAGAIGHGNVVSNVQFAIPSGATCNSQTAKPLSQGAITTFSAVGPLVVKQLCRAPVHVRAAGGLLRSSDRNGASGCVSPAGRSRW